MRRAYGVSLMAIVAVAVIALGATVASGNTPRLGLDLRGGESVVLRPTAPTKAGTLDKAIDIIRLRVDKLGVSEPDITRQGNNIIVELPGVKDPQRALSVVGQTAQLYFRPVLQVLPNAAPTPTTTRVTATSSTTAPAPTSTAPLSSTTAPTATSQPSALGTQPSARMTALELAAATSPAPADTSPPSGPAPAGATASSVPSAASATATTAPATTAASGANIPTTPPDQDDPTKTVVLPSRDNSIRYALAPATLDGTIISGATATIDSTTGAWLVDFTLTSSGSGKFDNMAKANYQKQVAIDLDGVVESAPTINAQQFFGRGQITGTFTSRQAHDLALVLRYGALPVRLEPETVQTVSATLGKDSLSAGLTAGLVGLILVALYMLLYYRALGLVVVAGLGVSGALMYSIITELGQSNGLALSLSGAIGIIVSVGVTVDSYVVYFERLKDEIRSGKTIRSSVDRGFARAYRTILAADAVSFIGAVLIYLLSVGAVRGFAFFLGLSTILDVFTAYVFTRPAVVLLGRNRLFTEARWLGVARGLAAEPAGGTA